MSSPSLETQVLGTIFEIEDWEDNESSKSSVLVHEGIVEVKNETEGIVLYEGDEVTLIESELSKTHSDNHNKNHMVNWEEERVNFKNISLKTYSNDYHYNLILLLKLVLTLMKKKG